MTRLMSVGLLLAIASTAGCCRMCCWRHGGSWSNGSCYLPQPVQTTVVPQATVPTVGVPQQTYVPATVPCTCAPVQ